MVVDQLLEIIKCLKEDVDTLKTELNRVKDLKNKPKITPGTLENNGDTEPGKKNRKKRQLKDKSTKKRKELPSREEIVKANDVPIEAEFKGYRPYTVQELIIHAEQIDYKLERWRLPDGTYLEAQLPGELHDTHYGPTLRAYIIHQYHHQCVTQPLLLQQLHELGIKISSGELDRLLTLDVEPFHQEKAGILSAGLTVSPYIHVDDTGARHKGKNGYCTHIGNELFAWFESTAKKSRINFLELLRQDHTDYVYNEEAFAYMERRKLAPYIRKKIKESGLYFATKDVLDNFLLQSKITTSRHKEIILEAGLVGSILKNGFSIDTIIISDDAGQFNVFRHALCWIHAERNIKKLIPNNEDQAKALKDIRNKIWLLYQELKEYKKEPSGKRKQELEATFNNLCKEKTCFHALNLQLQQLKKNQPELLLVLDRPDIPLHNNLSESDIREYVKRRKISAGTRSDLGRKSRDTFITLKKTGRKLGIAFWDYLNDRVRNLMVIPQLSELILQSAATKV